MSIRHTVRRLFWNVGLDITPFSAASHPVARKRLLLDSHKISLVLDVGANTGQFARRLRSDLGYRNRIVSFEPLSAAFRELERSAHGDPRWEVFRLALGDTEEDREINIANNSCSSSLLAMLPSHLKSAPEARYVGKETITIKK